MKLPELPDDVLQGSADMVDAMEAHLQRLVAEIPEAFRRRDDPEHEPKPFTLAERSLLNALEDVLRYKEWIKRASPSGRGTIARSP